MKDYRFEGQLGDGTFGSVLRAVHLRTGERVAIKKMKKRYDRWEDCLNLREYKSLKKLRHAHIVQLKELLRDSGVLYFVFEFMQCNLYQCLQKEQSRTGRGLPHSKVKSVMYQCLSALAYMHSAGYFHRDIKPENILVNDDDHHHHPSGTLLCKIADFGLAREIRSSGPFTEYVSTRWYRAPEVLLKDHAYSAPIDLWAMGAIMAEILTLRPLFPGNSEADTLVKIAQVLGAPTEWTYGMKLAQRMRFKFPKHRPARLSDLLGLDLSTQAQDLLYGLLQYDPSRRIRAKQALIHPWFEGVSRLIPQTTTAPRSGRGSARRHSRRAKEPSHQTHHSQESSQQQQQQPSLFVPSPLDFGGGIGDKVSELDMLLTLTTPKALETRHDPLPNSRAQIHPPQPKHHRKPPKPLFSGGPSIEAAKLNPKPKKTWAPVVKKHQHHHQQQQQQQHSPIMPSIHNVHVPVAGPVHLKTSASPTIHLPTSSHISRAGHKKPHPQPPDPPSHSLSSAQPRPNPINKPSDTWFRSAVSNPLPDSGGRSSGGTSGSNKKYRFGTSSMSIDSSHSMSSSGVSPATAAIVAKPTRRPLPFKLSQPVMVPTHIQSAREPDKCETSGISKPSKPPMQWKRKSLRNEIDSLLKPKKPPRPLLAQAKRYIPSQKREEVRHPTHQFQTQQRSAVGGAAASSVFHSFH